MLCFDVTLETKTADEDLLVLSLLTSKVNNNATDDGDTANELSKYPLNVLCSDAILDSIVDKKNLLLSLLPVTVDESTINEDDTDSDLSEDSLPALWSDGILEASIEDDDLLLSLLTFKDSVGVLGFMGTLCDGGFVAFGRDSRDISIIGKHMLS